MTVLESTVIALLGALVGVVLYVAAIPLVGLIPFGGEAIGAGALWVGFGLLAGVVASVAALAAVSAALGLRLVVISPLGVRTRQAAPRVHWLRLVLGVAAIAAAYLGLTMYTAFGDFAVMVMIFGTAFAVGIGVLNLIGPWAVSVAAKVSLRMASTPAKLIAARGILESPKAAWRQVSGVAMTSFIAVVAGSGLALLDALGEGGSSPDELNLIADVRTGILITLTCSFLMVACSVGVNQAAGILDRRDLYVSLDRLGMPTTVLEKSRARTVLSPLRFVTVGSALIGGILVLPMTGVALIVAPLSMLVIAGCLALGIGLVWLALLATRPVLSRVLAEPERL